MDPIDNDQELIWEIDDSNYSQNISPKSESAQILMPNDTPP